MKEILNFHIGQAGVQIGSALWELLCVEHLIDENGTMAVDNNSCLVECLDTFFTRTLNNKFVPRGIFIDLEPSVVDELKIGGYRHLFHPDRLIRGCEDAASNFARGFFTVGKVVLGQVANETRKLFEACDHLDGMILYRSLGGGTGSGLTSALFDVLADYPKTPKLEIPIYPSPTHCSSSVEPYNSILAEHFCIEDTDISLMFDNEAIYNICSLFLNTPNPTFTNVNRLIVQVIASITASMRFENTLKNDITLLQINIVPYPRIHFPLCNFAPLLNYQDYNHETLSTDFLTKNVFEKENQMIKVDVTDGRYMSCALFYRGDISPYDVYQTLSHIKRDRKLEFVEWCPTGFKVGIISQPPRRIPDSNLAPCNRNVAMLTNSSSIGSIFQRICQKFFILYSKRSFLHWFVGEGMEEQEFTESLYNITALVKDYEEVSTDSSESKPKMDKTEQTDSKSPRHVAPPTLEVEATKQSSNEPTDTNENNPTPIKLINRKLEEKVRLLTQNMLLDESTSSQSPSR